MKAVAYLLLLCVVGCSSTNEPALSRLRGSMRGKLFVETLTSEIPRYGGERISAIGVDSVYRTTCDSNGFWEFSGLPSGSYTLLFERDGFSSARISGMQFVGGGTADIPFVALFKLYDAPVFDSVGERVSSDGHFGYVIFVHGANTGLTLCVDRDSSVLANWISDAADCDWQGYFSQNEFNIPIVWNDEVRRYQTPIHQGDFFYVAIGPSTGSSLFQPNQRMESGHFSFMPFKRPVTIVRLQYNGRP